MPVAFSRPLFRSPAGAWVEQCKCTCATLSQALIACLFRDLVVRKLSPRRLQGPAHNSFRERQILFHYMRALRDDWVRVKHGRDTFTRLSGSIR